MDIEKLKDIIALLSGTDVTSLEWKSAGESIAIHRLGPPQASGAPAANLPSTAAPAPLAVVPPPAEARRLLVTSPFVGTFYRSPSPDAPSFVEVGQAVRKGQVLCIVEAMKLMNEIEAEVDGRVAEILAQNGQPVEFGEPLFRLEPA